MPSEEKRPLALRATAAQEKLRYSCPDTRRRTLAGHWSGEAILTGSPLRSSVLLTFDDGYLDNYTLAFPVLRSHGVQAVFFLPTAFIGTAHLPLWDVIGYVVRQTRK